MYPIPTELIALDKQPVEFIEEVAGLYFRSIVLECAGDTVPQHSHDHDHATLVGAGSVRMWVNGCWLADIPAGHAVKIKAATQHLFQALEPNTRLTCVHDASSAESLQSKGA